jgi:Zn-dependent protease with chaperone function
LDEPEFSNPQVPNHVNVSQTHPLADFSRLLGGIVVVGAVIFSVLMLAADRLARFIPFSVEVDVAERIESSLPPPGEVAVYLQSLADELAIAHALPEDMHVKVHYVDEDVVNAFATLGGNVVVYRGLLRKMPSENAVAMVLSHEIAHIKLRHPISSLGRGFVLGIGLGLVSSTTGGDIASNILGSAGLLSALSFSRDQERHSDAEGIAAVAEVYGHVAGSDEVFRVIQREMEEMPVRPPDFLLTHPLDDERIRAVSEMASLKGWSLAGEQTEIPPAIAGAIRNPDSIDSGSDKR